MHIKLALFGFSENLLDKVNHILPEGAAAERFLLDQAEPKPRLPDYLAVDIIIIEMSSLWEGAIPILRVFIEAFPGQDLIVMSDYNEAVLAEEILAIGAKAYITTHAAEEELPKALALIKEGKLFISDELG
ncbi:MAG: hypothetical protein R8P61_35130 [Bacteroidia bacterium]|nr:hypothetical protein [Bacteroidia bacterium]